MKFLELFLNILYLYFPQCRQLQQAPSVDDQGQDKDVSTQEQQQEVRKCLIVLQVLNFYYFLCFYNFDLVLLELYRFDLNILYDSGLSQLTIEPEQ